MSDREEEEAEGSPVLITMFYIGLGVFLLISACAIMNGGYAG